MNEDSRADVAVFFDFENIVFSVRNNYNINANFEDLMDKCKEFGRVVVARAFADWNRQSPAMIPALMSNGFDPVYVPSFHTTINGRQELRKNSVDMYMAIDAMDVMHNRRNVNTFILLTGDSDFLPLVNAIRREGNRVIAIGVDGCTSSHLAQSVDDFIFYSQVSSLPDTNKRRGRPSSIYDGIVQAIKRLEADNKSTVLPNVKMMMGELLGGFDEKKHTDRNGRKFQKFKEFVQEAERRGLVRLVTTGTVNEVFLPDKEGKSNSKASKNGQQKEKSNEKQTKQPSLSDAFDLLVEAVNTAQTEKKSSRPSVIKNMLVKMYPGFDEKEITTADGKPFRKFGDFVKMAEQDGLVQVVGKGRDKEIKPVPHKESKESKKAETGKEAESKKAESSADTGGKQEESKPKLPPVNDLQKVDDKAARRLIVDALRSFDPYPAPFLKVEAYCRHVRNERKVYLPSPKVRELLTEATREMGLLRRVSPPGVSPAQYEFQDDEALIASYLGEQPAAAQTQKTAERPSGLEQAFELLRQAVQKAEESGKSQRLSAIKSRMVRMQPGFSEKEIPGPNGSKFKRFGEFAQAAEEAGFVKLSGKGMNAQISSAKK